MPTHEPFDPESGEDEIVDTSKGYEARDVRVSGVVVFLTALGIFAVLSALLAYGLGKFINRGIAHDDGPKNRWAAPVDLRPLGNLPSSPAMRQKLGNLTNGFPLPQLQTDDGLQDLAELHAREDILLDSYSWVDSAQGKVRIPIDRAMELIAQRGLPVAPAVDHEKLLAGEHKPSITAPLTTGFVRTGYEQEQAQAVEARQSKE
jgi:hypothetical protein